MADILSPVVPKNRRCTLERIEKFISHHYFTDVNIFGRLNRSSENIESILHYGPTDRISISTVIQDLSAFKPVKTGDSFGPTFSTHWFILSFEVLSSWKDEDVELEWDSGCEAMLWRDEVPFFSFTPQEDEGCRKSYRLSKEEKKQKRLQYVVEMACNRELGEGSPTMISPPDMNKKFSLNKVRINVKNKDLEAIFLDLQVLYDITKTLGENNQRGIEAMFVGNQIINTLVMQEWSDHAVKESRDLSKSYFSERNHKLQHHVHAMGHCHIDCAWLWPYSETRRKCARSWVSVLNIMKRYPDFTFVCSQAQQFAWVKSDYPQLFEEIKTQVKNGRFIPVGGTWVEMDGNLPSGESMMMQFFYGQKFFREEFGITCDEFWLPDTFGYSGNFPQIMKESGIDCFLTQKLSWNLVNKFPHHTFYWQGIDGSRQLTHFPPGESYGMSMKAEELMKTLNNHKDKGRSNSSIFLFGFGDGGGGPNDFMLERFERMKDTAGLPRVEMSTPKKFFEEVKTKSSNLCSWVGELFLELHNGSYTSQAMIKEQNRKCEVLLHDLQLLCTMAWCYSRYNSNKYNYPHEEINEIWKKFLLNQFHDVLPGTSIEMVTTDALKLYDEVIVTAAILMKKGKGSLGFGDSGGVCPVVINTLPWKRKEVVSVKGELAYVECQATGYQEITDCNYTSAVVALEMENGDLMLCNGLIECRFDKCGRMVSLCIMTSQNGVVCKQECVAKDKYANQFVIFDDVPLYWDAWDVMDYHLQTGKHVTELVEPLCLSGQSKLQVSCKFSLMVGKKSKITQTISLDVGSPLVKFKTEVSWNEDHKFLKVEFPWNIQTNRATYEIQYGHIERPNHQNTSWESAKFEVWAHKWADLSQHNLGVSILNDSKYGYSCFGNTMRLSLLRSPKSPDANADMGDHVFTYAVMPHKGTFQESEVIQQAYQLNYPMLVDYTSCRTLGYSFAKVSRKEIILESCMKSQMHSNAVLIRLYESYGSSVQDVTISFPNLNIEKVHRCNTLEDLKGEIKVEGNSFTVNFTPFQIKSFICTCYIITSLE
ncbi:alpha-mannosidase 2C1 [Ciona intestinalis]